MSMPRDTGSPRADAESDFLRARRQQVLGAIAGRVRGRSARRPLSFDEACTALGLRGERSLGVLVIPLSRVVGSVDKVQSFDTAFRPTSGRMRHRWERLAEAFRRGESIPPIDVYRLGDLYFVRDGHHRVSVAKALGLDVIEANVTEVLTAVSPEGVADREDLDRKHWRRIFLERVPLTGTARRDLEVTEPAGYHQLAELVEAWSARLMHAERSYSEPRVLARRWYEEEFLPVLEMIAEAGLALPGETAADAYLRLAGERYELSREHTWDADVLEAIGRRRRKRR